MTIIQMMKKIIITSLILFSLPSASENIFEDLDKPPQGAHAGQIFAGASCGMGWASGSIIDAENKFVKGTTKTFEDSEITKEVDLQHYSLAFSLFGEYMPVDYVGVRGKINRRMITQKTLFGSDLPNTQKTLFSSYDIFAGPNFHLTQRKSWDVTFFPFAGISFGKMNSTPVAKSILTGYSANTENSVNSFAFGCELSGVFYFSGGFFVSLGGEWASYSIKTKSGISRTSPLPAATYNNGKTSGRINSLMVSLSAGYAFEN